MRGVDVKSEKDVYRHERVVWVKYDGDRLSRQMITTVDTQFEDFLCAAILQVDALGRLVEYCLACNRSRTMADVFTASEGDCETTILQKKYAFASRE
jgi:hypothetical protein